MVGPDGRTYNVYECRFCCDAGIISMPKQVSREGIADLVSVKAMMQRGRVAYYCPACRPPDAARRLYVRASDRFTIRERLPDHTLRRLRLWLDARGQQIMEEDERAKLEAGLKLPPLRPVEQVEAASGKLVKEIQPAPAPFWMGARDERDQPPSAEVSTDG
jgi:hypothetical protein